MLQVVIVLIRVLLGLLLAFLGILSAMIGLFFLARQGAHLFGSEGVLLLIGLLMAAALCAGSWKLLRTTLRLPATVSASQGN